MCSPTTAAPLGAFGLGFDPGGSFGPNEGEEVPRWDKRLSFRGQPYRYAHHQNGVMGHFQVRFCDCQIFFKFTKEDCVFVFGCSLDYYCCILWATCGCRSKARLLSRPYGLSHPVNCHPRIIRSFLHRAGHGCNSRNVNHILCRNPSLSPIVRIVDHRCYVLSVARWEHMLSNCSYRPLKPLTQQIYVNLVLLYDNHIRVRLPQVLCLLPLAFLPLSRSPAPMEQSPSISPVVWTYRAPTNHA